MTNFAFTELVPNKFKSTALGATGANEFSTEDVNKAVKLGTANNYLICAGGDEIEGFVGSVEAFTVNDGFSFGGVQEEGRRTVKVGPAQVGSVAVGDLVVADVQTALGTADYATVKTGAPTSFKWRCINIISGTGAAGDLILLERI